MTALADHIGIYGVYKVTPLPSPPVRSCWTADFKLEKPLRGTPPATLSRTVQVSEPELGAPKAGDTYVFFLVAESRLTNAHQKVKSTEEAFFNMWDYIWLERPRGEPNGVAIDHTGKVLTGRGEVLKVIEAALKLPRAHPQIDRWAYGEDKDRARYPNAKDFNYCVISFPTTNTLRERNTGFWLGMVCGGLVIPSVLYEEALPVPQGRPTSRGVSWAAMYGDLDLLKRLEATGADLDAPDTHSFNWTPLMAAVIHRQTDVVQYLLTRKISLDSQDLWGQTVLMWAIRTSDTNTVWRLLEKGANPAIRDKAGVTALGHAETSPHRVALSKWLKEHHPAGRQSN